MTEQPRTHVPLPRCGKCNNNLRHQFGTPVIDLEGYTGTVRRYRRHVIKPAHEPDMVLVQLDNPQDRRWIRWYREDELSVFTITDSDEIPNSEQRQGRMMLT